jgi:signal transduction histidine kinase
MRLFNLLSLRAKIALCVAGVILVVGLSGALFTQQILTTTLRQELEQRGVNIATSLATRSVNRLLRGDFFELHLMLRETLSKSRDVRYIFLLDPVGNVIDHTFEEGFPTDLLAIPTPQPGQDYRAQLLQTEEGYVRDIAVPVLDRRAGTLHVGMAESHLAATVGRAVLDLLIATGLALVAAVSLAWFLAHLVTRPILRLVGVAEAVRGGDLTRRASLTSRDEVGRLGRAFDTMTERLAARIQELEDTNVKLAALNSIAISLSKAAQLDSVLSETLEKSLALVQADAGGVLLWGGREVGYRVHKGFSQTYVEGLASLVLDKEETTHLLDYWEYPALEPKASHSRLLPWIERDGLQAFISLPFWVGGEMQGALHMARRSKLPFSPRDRELLSGVVAQVGITLTNRQLLEEASQAEALRQLNQMKSEFAVRASHELRTPATAIKGYIETLLRPDMALDRSQRRQLLEDMNDVSDRLNRLVQDVLNVSRLESGALPVKKDRLAVRPLLQRVVRRLRRQSPRHRLKLRLEKGLGEALGDGDRIEDVLENLISNAIKYSPGGGTITVSAHREVSPGTDGRAQIGRTFGPVDKATEFITISVADEGIGIPAEEVPRLFQRFYQVSGRDGARASGIGMGLFICKSYVEAMGGDIWVESQEGKGSTFSFRIPAAEPPSRTISWRVRAPVTARHRGR